MQTGESPTAPLRLRGVIFAFALNLILVSLTLILLSGLAFDLRASSAIVLGAAVVAGLLTARYTRRRGAIHAFLGGMATIPVLGLFLLDGNWSFAILAASFCTVGGILGQRFLRNL